MTRPWIDAVPSVEYPGIVECEVAGQMVGRVVLVPPTVPDGAPAIVRAKELLTSEIYRREREQAWSIDLGGEA